MNTPFYIFGAGGQAKCIINALLESDDYPSAVIDDHPNSGSLLGVPLFSSDHHTLFQMPFRFIVAIGNPVIRREKFDMLKGLGGKPQSVIHPKASVSNYAQIGDGTVVFTNAMVDPCVAIGENAIINVGALVGHDSRVADDAHVSAGAIVGAMCRINEGAFVGIGAIVNPGVTVGPRCYIAMGALISKDVPADTKAISPQRKEAILLPVHA